MVAGGADFFPLEEVKAGLRGVGKTVFAGSAIEEFDVEILGVLENVGPRQSLILARLSGGPLAKTGVMAGMSGSPVYLDGRLVGAVAFSFQFSTEPLCGIRPIGEMVADVETREQVAGLSGLDLAAMRAGERPLIPAGGGVRERGEGLIPIATPVSFGGFSARTLDVFGETLRGLGLRPMQGLGGSSSDGDEAPVEPGSMISVGLIRGDLNAVASWTVTHVDGDRLFAFGHSFLQAGPTQLPMMRASVLTLAPNLSNSFKLTGSGELLGRVTLDRSAAIVGELGAAPDTVPVTFSVRDGVRERRYRMELARDAFLTPFLLQMATFAALDATERQIGPSTVRVRGRALFRSAPPLELADVYAGSTGAIFAAAAGTAAPLAFLMQTAPGDVELDSIELELETTPREMRWRIAEAWAERTEVHPGEDVTLAARLRGPGGAEKIVKEVYRVPSYLPVGELRVSFSDALRLNVSDFPLLMDSTKLTAAELVGMINRLRRSDGLYLRVQRTGAAYRVGGERLNAPPASLRVAVDKGAAGAKERVETLLERAVWRAEGEVAGQAEVRMVVVE